MKKILLVIPALNAGGAERVMVTLANEWVKSNKVDLLLFDEGESFYKIDKSVNIIGLNLKLPKDGILRIIKLPFVEIKRLLNISRIVSNGNYDFVLSFTFMANMFCSIISKWKGKKNIFVSERNDPTRYKRVIQILITCVYRWSKAVICQNEYVKNYYNKHGFDNLIVLENPVLLHDIPLNLPTVRRHIIVNVGRLTKQKNQEILIDSFEVIKDEFKDYQLYIYGKGELKQELTQLIKSKGLEDRVFLMGTRKNIMKEINDMSLFVLSSDYEGFPNVLVEAMANGMPVISSNFKTGVAKKLIKSDKNGYIFEPGNKDDLIDKLRRILIREDEFNMIGEANRVIAKKYDSGEMAADWLRVISEDYLNI